MEVDLKRLINSGISSLKPYEPGKSIEDLERELRISGAIKLASNENPIGPSPKALKAVSNFINNISRYPDGNGSSLKKALSKKYQINEDQITLGNGSNDIIEFIARCFLSVEDNAIYSKHAFAIYPLVVQSNGAKGIEIPAKEWGHDLKEMLTAVNKKTKIVFIANPNNPTGTHVSKEEIESFLNQVSSDVIVLLDQAYFDYSSYEKEEVGFDFVDRFPNLVISRTFSKSYGLAGLRIGYSVSTKEIADYFNRIRQPFNVNSLALAAAEAALDDKEHLSRTLKMNREEKETLYEGLVDQGYKYIPSLANFICFDCKTQGKKRFNNLLKEAVIVRSMEVYKMPQHLRVTIGLPEENKKFIKKLSTFY